MATTLQDKYGDKVAELMGLIVDEALRYMERNGCTMAEARDAAAAWVWETQPALAAAITLLDEEVAA
jgi:hypothetical protein